MSEQIILSRRERVAQRRRRAALILDEDEDATQSLLKMAAAIEADIAQLEAEPDVRARSAPPPGV
jgi:hypothetical protein